jgi:lipoprotein-anchoring transpeptidase ErfK/SrfK
MTALLVVTLLMLALVNLASAETEYIVQPGDTLTRVARQYGITIQELAEANELRPNSWLYMNQTLIIPDKGSETEAPSEKSTEVSIEASSEAEAAETAPEAEEAVEVAASAPSEEAPATTGSYLVQGGDTLYGIAVNHGTSVEALMIANNLRSSLIRVGQSLSLPDGSTVVERSPQAFTASNPAVNGEKWIDINLSTQTITAYEGNSALYSAIVSTGLPRTPTVVGSYNVYIKYTATDMQGGSHAYGDYYYLPNVPYTMYFYGGYGIHGTYWHNNFGQPMSHGCVNLRTSDAKWFFDWAPVGTKVETHY